MPASDSFWFTQMQAKWEVSIENGKRIFRKIGYEKRSWRNSFISAFSIGKRKVRVVVRSKDTVYSYYMGRNIDVMFMYTFDISRVLPPSNKPTFPWYWSSALGRFQRTKSPKIRWVLDLQKENNELDSYKHCRIWQWAADGAESRSSPLYALFIMLEKKLNDPPADFAIDQDVWINKETRTDEPHPVIYQPSTDGWKNFVRQIHCHKHSNEEYDVTLIFNDERLRRHWYLQWLYLLFRKIIYQRTADVESFKIILRNGHPQYLSFPGIYSEEYHDITDDSIHGDREWFFIKAPKRRIQIYSNSINHPVIFVNTSNHAMAEYDNNPNLWKWEYISGDDNGPIITGTRSRKEIDKLLTHVDEDAMIRALIPVLEEDQIHPQERSVQILHIYVDWLQRNYLIGQKYAEQLVEKSQHHRVARTGSSMN